MKKYYQLQNVLFSNDERLDEHVEMFYRGTRPAYDTGKKCIVIGAGLVTDFCTYFNCISLLKWKTYTFAEKLILRLRIQGNLEIVLTGFEKKEHQYVRKILARKKYFAEEPQDVEIVYPDNHLMLAGFEVHTMGLSMIYGGEYGTEVEEEQIRPLSLHLVTTTFKKEEYILSNIALLKESILRGQDALAEHLWIHVVDNGRTLSPEDLEEEHVMVHPNLNVGGAGGFTRGMIEAFAHREKPTHVLLMDDDVKILPESIRRTYQLLGIIRPEYENYFISGAMLQYERMNWMHEDVGYVHSENGQYGPLKRPVDTTIMEDILRCEEFISQTQNGYAGWWYCCIPASVISMKNLPLPVFVRGDDVEYSLRNHARFITMCGICIWHMGFTNKFSGSMELYQVHRNSLMLQAVSGVCRNVDFMERIRKLVRVELLRFDYDGAELLLDAVEDYMKGYRFFMKNQGEKLLKEKTAKNEKMIPLSEIENAPENVWCVYEKAERSATEVFLYRLTYNGHFWPQKLLKKEPGICAYDWFYVPHHYFFRRKLLVINPHFHTGAWREIDRKRFLKLFLRQKKLWLRYKRIHEKLEQDYRRHKDLLTSEKFWRRYLQLDKKEKPV